MHYFFQTVTMPIVGRPSIGKIILDPSTCMGGVEYNYWYPNRPAMFSIMPILPFDSLPIVIAVFFSLCR